MKKIKKKNNVDLPIFVEIILKTNQKKKTTRKDIILLFNKIIIKK